MFVAKENPRRPFNNELATTTISSQKRFSNEYVAFSDELFPR